MKFILVGLAAQMVDGALGMAYGATCSSFLLGLGIPPSMASASVHIAEIFTTGASGLAHLRFGNVNKKLFLYLLIPGVIGAVLGAYVLSDVIEGNTIKPFIAAYLLVLGLVILRKAIRTSIIKRKTKNLGWLAAFGGFMDSIGGGGWGPIVTSTLLSSGRSANYTIGSVNLAEFFIALAGGGTFLFFTGVNGWQAIIGLILGGVFASPLAALVVAKIKRRPLMIIVGLLIITLSIRTFIYSDINYLLKLIKF
ncbi:MAG: sulfite exporter TauE/SafE family protein [Cytophagales bacterium]|nr:sulfite exporter TauE/SafE family protein [Cytophagales bacterium]